MTAKRILRAGMNLGEPGMSIQRALLPVICFGLMLGCVTVTSTQLGKPSTRNPISAAEVAIYRTAQQVPGNYEEVALLNASGDYEQTDESQMYAQMRKEAGRLGANGIILESVSEPTTGAKVANFFVGTDADRKGKAIAIYIHPSGGQTAPPESASSLVTTSPQGAHSSHEMQRPQNPNEFKSPWIVEVAFAPLDPGLWMDEDWTPEEPKPWRKGAFTTVEYHSLGKYSCDGLFLRHNDRGWTWNSGLTMKVKTNDDGIHIEIEAHVTNPKLVHDKLVTLSFEVITGEMVSGSSTVKLKVDQGDESSKTAKLILPPGSMGKGLAAKLRITMTSQDN